MQTPRSRHLGLVRILLSFLLFTPVLSAKTPPWEGKLLVDVYGLGSFNRSAEGDFPSKVAKSLIPPGYTPPPGSIPPNSTQFSGRPGWGGGLGITALLSRYIGISLDQSAIARQPGSRDPKNADFGYARLQTSATASIRVPIPGTPLVPYALAGGGAQYGSCPSSSIPGYKGKTSSRFALSGQGFGQVGGGAEYWLTRRMGVFGDLRWMFSSVRGLPGNQMQTRYGVRMSF